MSTNTFSKGLTDANAAFLKAVERGVTLGALALARDTVTVENTVPKVEGTLRGSVSIHVQGKCVATGKDLGLAESEPMTGATEKGRDGILGSVGFNMIYAHRLHEGDEDWNWSQEGSGPKYLESKMAANPDKYFRGIQKETAEALRHG